MFWVRRAACWEWEWGCPNGADRCPNPVKTPSCYIAESDVRQNPPFWGQLACHFVGPTSLAFMRYYGFLSYASVTCYYCHMLYYCYCIPWLVYSDLALTINHHKIYFRKIILGHSKCKWYLIRGKKKRKITDSTGDMIWRKENEKEKQ